MAKKGKKVGYARGKKGRVTATPSKQQGRVSNFGLSMKARGHMGQSKKPTGGMGPAKPTYCPIEVPGVAFDAKIKQPLSGMRGRVSCGPAIDNHADDQPRVCSTRVGILQNSYPNKVFTLATKRKEREHPCVTPVDVQPTSSLEGSGSGGVCEDGRGWLGGL